MKTRKPLNRKPSMPRSAPGADRKPNVSPQDQAMYDRVVLMARRVLFGDPNDDTRFKFVVQRLAASTSELPNAIGHLAATVLANIAGAAQKQGKQIPGYILFHAGQTVIGDIVDIARSLGIVKDAQVKSVAEAAVLVGLQVFKKAMVSATSGGQAAPPSTPNGAQPPAPTAPSAPPAPPPQAQPGIINSARA